MLIVYVVFLTDYALFGDKSFLEVFVVVFPVPIVLFNGAYISSVDIKSDLPDPKAAS